MYLYCQNCQFQTSRQLYSRNFKRNSFENMFQSSHIYFTQYKANLNKYKKSFKKYFANICMIQLLELHQNFYLAAIRK